PPARGPRRWREDALGGKTSRAPLSGPASNDLGAHDELDLGLGAGGLVGPRVADVDLPGRDDRPDLAFLLPPAKPVIETVINDVRSHDVRVKHHARDPARG